MDADSLDGKIPGSTGKSIAVVNGQQFRRSGSFERPASVQTAQQRTARVVRKPSVPDVPVVEDGDSPNTSAINPKIEVMMKREQRMREEEAHYTYKPQLATAKVKKDSVKQKEDVNRFDRLYSDALKRHLESKWKEANGEDELTFQPKISKKGSRSSSRTRSASKDRGVTRPSTDETTNRLHSTRTGRLKETPDEYSFQPTISKRAKSIDRKESLKRLYDLNEPKEKKEQRLAELKRQELEECTFKPATSNNGKYSKKASAMDVAERMAKYEEMKARRLQLAQQEKEEAELDGVTFKPELIGNKKRASTPTQQQPFHIRLNKSIDRSDDRVTTEANAEMTFKPKLVSKPARRSQSPSGRGNVHDRLFVEGQQKKKETELQAKMTKEEMESSFTFSPAINPRSKAVASNQSDNSGVPVFERLATANSMQYMQDVLQKVKADLELQECTFQPKLMTQGTYVDRSQSSVPIFERLNQEGERHKQELEKQVELIHQQREREMSFAPQINETSKELVKHRSASITPKGGATINNADVYARLNAEEIECHTIPPQLDTEKDVTPANVTLTPKQQEAVGRRLSTTQTHHINPEVEQEHYEIIDGLRSPQSPYVGGGFGATDGMSVVSRTSRASRTSRQSMSEKEIDGVVERLHKGRSKSATPAKEKPRNKPLITPSTIHQVYKNREHNRSTFDFMDNPITTPTKDEIQKKAPASKEEHTAGEQQAERIVHESSATTSATKRSLSAPRSAIRKNTVNAGDLLPQPAPKSTSSGATAPPAPPSGEKTSSKVGRKGSSSNMKGNTQKESKKSGVPPSKSTDAAASGDEFAAKIERSLSLLGMTPEEVTAAQREAEEEEAAVTANSGGTKST